MLSPVALARSRARRAVSSFLILIDLVEFYHLDYTFRYHAIMKFLHSHAFVEFNNPADRQGTGSTQSPVEDDYIRRLRPDKDIVGSADAHRCFGSDP